MTRTSGAGDVRPTDHDVEAVRLAVYRGFASGGHAPSPDAMARDLGLDRSEVAACLVVLDEQRHLVLRDGRLVMAHPFTTVPLGFSVMGANVLWWGGCAWDSFAIPHLVPEEPEVLVATRCPGCQRAVALTVTRAEPPAGDLVAHFLTPTAHMWDDVVWTCGHQSLFCSDDCVDDWLTATGHPPGYRMDLTTLWRLAAGWYAGRLDPGYVRREPAAAAAYFREVGLSGAFWGIDPA